MRSHLSQIISQLDGSRADIVAPPLWSPSSLPGPEVSTWLDDRESALERGSQSAVPTFLPREHAASRFRIVRLVGQGGMGQVFEAYDEELATRVALKVMRPEVAGSQRAMDLFKQEVQLAREVTHPNVCRIFDFFVHDPGNTDWGKRREKTPFLTMEFLEGETLRRRMGAAAAPSRQEVRAWTEQLVGGLAAIHRVGITHRDLKPENILLAPRDSGVRPVITDFGLAIGAPSGEGTNPSLTAGTPAYAAPEQKAGEAVTPATDIYSFGMILLELLEAAEPSGSTVRRSTAASLDERLRRLGSPWASALRRCLEKRPEDRFPNAADLRLALFPPSHRAQWVLWTAGAVGLLAASLLIRSPGGASNRVPSPPAASTAIAEPAAEEPLIQSPRPTLAIPPFSVSAIEDRELAELLWAGVVNVFKNRSEVRLLRDPALVGSSIGHSHEALAALADISLSGFLARNPETGLAELTWRLSRSDRKLPPVSQAFEADGPNALRSIEDLTEAIALQLREVGLASFEIDEGQLGSALSGFPQNEVALELFAGARLDFRAERYSESLDKLRRAETLEPDARELSLVRSDALSALGFDRRAAAASGRAFRQARDAPQEVRDRLETLHFVRQGKWTEAVRGYRSLWARYPDDSAYGLALAEAQLFGARLEEAAESLDNIEESSPNEIDRIHVDLLRSYIARHQGDTHSQGDYAHRASNRSLRLGVPDLLLESLLYEADARYRTGDTVRHKEVVRRFEREAAKGTWSRIKLAKSVLEFSSFGGPNQALPLGLSLPESGEILGAVGNIRDQARIQVLQAQILSREPAARSRAFTLAQGGLRLAHRAESPKAEAEAHRALGILHHLEANYLKASEHFAAVVKAARETGELVQLGAALNNYGLELHRLGRLRQAQETLFEVVDLFRRNGEQRGLLLALLVAGEISAELGDLPAASEQLAEAYRHALHQRQPSLLARAAESRAAVLDMQGLVEEADLAYGEALKLWGSYGPGAGRRTRLHLAYRDAKDGDLEDAKAAEEKILLLLSESEPGRDPNFRRLAHFYLSRILLQQGRSTEAAQILEREQTALGPALDRYLEFELACATALVEAARGHSDTAVQRIQNKLATAEANGSIHHQLQLRLLLGQILDSGGHDEAAASQLNSVVRLAEELGFSALAWRARRAASPPHLQDVAASLR